MWPHLVRDRRAASRPPRAWIGLGDEVRCVLAYTFPPTGDVSSSAAREQFSVDVDPDTFDLDIAAVAEAAMRPRTRAVMAVHLFGRPMESERPSRPLSRRW